MDEWAQALVDHKGYVNDQVDEFVIGTEDWKLDRDRERAQMMESPT